MAEKTARGMRVLYSVQRANPLANQRNILLDDVSNKDLDHPGLRVINTDEHAGYPPAIARLKSRADSAGELSGIDRCSTQIMVSNKISGLSNPGYVQANIFASVYGAWRTIAGGP